MQGLNPNQMDENMSDEIPNPQIDKKLQNIVIRNMVHGPCGTLNPKSPCMKDGKCTKMYPRQLISETQTSRDGYPIYRRMYPMDECISCSTAWDYLIMFIIMLLFNLEYK